MKCNAANPLALFFALTFAGCSGGGGSAAPSEPPTGAKEVTLEGKGGTVYGYAYEAKSGKSEKVILCFHQAGSNAWEYATIAPIFADWGFDVLAIDQRSGGDMFGHANRTAEKATDTEDYMAAYPDMEAALEWAKTKGYKTIIALGSSYSASLVIKLALDHAEVSGIIAFSPGEYFDDKRAVHTWTQRIDVPHLFAATKDEADEEVRGLFFATEEHGDGKAILLSHPDGEHGASSLIEDKCKAAGFYRKGVEDWLKLVGG